MAHYSKTGSDPAEEGGVKTISTSHVVEIPHGNVESIQTGRKDKELLKPVGLLLEQFLHPCSTGSSL